MESNMQDRSHQPEFLFNLTYAPRDNFWLSFNDILYNVSCLSMALNNKEDPLFIKKIVENTRYRLEELQRFYSNKLMEKEETITTPYDGICGVSMDGFMRDEYESHNR